VEGTEPTQHVGVGDDDVVRVGRVGGHEGALEAPGRRQIGRRAARWELAEVGRRHRLLGVPSDEGDATEAKDDETDHHEDDGAAKEAHRVHPTKWTVRKPVVVVFARKTPQMRLLRSR
jgi:hypothetical protein